MPNRGQSIQGKKRAIGSRVQVAWSPGIWSTYIPELKTFGPPESSSSASGSTTQPKNTRGPHEFSKAVSESRSWTAPSPQLRDSGAERGHYDSTLGHGKDRKHNILPSSAFQRHGPVYSYTPHRPARSKLSEELDSFHIPGAFPTDTNAVTGQVQQNDGFLDGRRKFPKFKDH